MRGVTGAKFSLPAAGRLGARRLLQLSVRRIEGEVNEKQLQQANVSSWEHGLLRERESRHMPPVTRHFFAARGEADAPDIDGRVHVQGKLPIGEFAHVKIVGHTDYDLIAERA